VENTCLHCTVSKNKFVSEKNKICFFKKVIQKDSMNITILLSSRACLIIIAPIYKPNKNEAVQI